MNYSEGGFVLRQILASSIVVGPLLILIGSFFYLYRQERRVTVLYLSVGLLLTVLGAVCLYYEFKDESLSTDRSPSSQYIEAIRSI